MLTSYASPCSTRIDVLRIAGTLMLLCTVCSTPRHSMSARYFQPSHFWSAHKHQIWLFYYSHHTTGHKKTLYVFSTPPLGKEACDWTTAALVRVIIIQPLSELTPSSVPTSSSPHWAHGQHPAVWPLSPERWLGLYPAGALYSEKRDRDVCVACDTYGDQHGIHCCFSFADMKRYFENIHAVAKRSAEVKQWF